MNEKSTEVCVRFSLDICRFSQQGYGKFPSSILTAIWISLDVYSYTPESLAYEYI